MHRYFSPHHLSLLSSISLGQSQPLNIVSYFPMKLAHALKRRDKKGKMVIKLIKYAVLPQVFVLYGQESSYLRDVRCHRFT